jgi:hypothetical protein
VELRPEIWFAFQSGDQPGWLPRQTDPLLRIEWQERSKSRPQYAERITARRIGMFDSFRPGSAKKQRQTDLSRTL